MPMSRIITLAAALALAAAAPAARGQEARLVRTGTGSLTGVYFPVGVALCRLVNETRREHGIRCSAQPSEGSVANVEALRAGEIDLAIVQSDVQNQAWSGAGMAEFPELRAVMALYPEPLTVVARGDAGIAELGDLEGERVSYGSPGSGQRVVWDAVMGAMGWTPDSFSEGLELEPTAQAQALCADRIDAFAMAVGHPALTVQEATLGCESRLVPAAGPQIDRLVEGNPDYFAARIPGGLYRGNPDPTETFGVGATLVTRADVADDAIGTLVRSVMTEIETLRGLHPVLAGLDPATMAEAGLTAPLHPAAESYYRERGWIE
jgi:uncharacterized protein